MTAGAWIADAVCSTIEDPSIFFPAKGGTARLAKAVCADCPVKQPCLQLALDNHETHGVWGGLSQRELRAVRRGALA